MKLQFKINDSFEKDIFSTQKNILNEDCNSFDANYLLRLANSFRALKQYDKAELTYKKVIEADVTSAKACYAFGLFYIEYKEYEKAIIYFKKAIKLDREFYLGLYGMAKAYDKLGKYELCFFYLEKAIKINPDFDEALYSMAQYYRKMKNEKKMQEFLLKTLVKRPEHPGANHLLSSLNEETSSYSLEYARDLFDRYADFFEDHLINTLKYKVPFIIKEKLKSLNLSKDSRILDLGCGTGLLGKTIVDIFPNLVGVDISSNMIEETRKKDIYSKLHINDIDDFLLNNKEEFDLIVAPDVFIYIADLQTIFSCIKKCLSKDGYFIFTIEPMNGVSSENSQLEKSGRVSHSLDYVKTLSKSAGFEIVENEEIILREENKIGQKGFIFTLKTKSL